jgi:hypothetical protein
MIAALGVCALFLGTALLLLAPAVGIAVVVTGLVLAAVHIERAGYLA